MTIVNFEGISIAYLKGSEMTGVVIEPYPTIDPNGGVPEIYNYINNVVFGTYSEIAARDSMSTLSPSDPNIVGTEQDMFEYNNYAVYLQATLMSDGSRWFDLSGDGKPETHIKTIGGSLYYDSDLNGTFDKVF